MSIDILKYETVEGSIPLDEWLADLRDRRAKARVLIRLDRLELGLEGHWRSVGGRRQGTEDSRRKGLSRVLRVGRTDDRIAALWW